MDTLRTLFDLFPYAIYGGGLITLACSAMGLFTILNRMVFVGITLAEVASCGVAASIAMHVPPFAGAFIFCIMVMFIIISPPEERRISRETLLGLLFVFSASLSILIVSKSAFGLSEVKALLYGDLILASAGDFRLILYVILPVMLFFTLFFRPIYYTFLDRDGAKLMGINVRMWEYLYFFFLTLVISAASKVTGALLIFSMLIVAPATGLAASTHLKTVMSVSILSGLLSLMAGLYLSLEIDLPVNQTVSVLGCLLFVAVFFLGRFRGKRRG